MKLAGRLFLGSCLLLAITVLGLIVAVDEVLRGRIEGDMAEGLEREAHLVSELLPHDTTAWEHAARTLGALIGHRITLIDPAGHVRGDTEFDRAALARLENHAGRPEVMEALASGTGRGTDERLSVSTNQRRLYVAVRSAVPGLAVVRLSTTLDALDAEIGSIERGVAFAGFAALGVAAFLAWILSGTVAHPLVQLGGAARAIAAGETPHFPNSRIPEIADHIFALNEMHEQLQERFREVRREREEMQTLIESMTEGVLAADATGNVVTVNSAARQLLGMTAGTVPIPPPPLGEWFHDKQARELVRDAFTGNEIVQRELDLDGRSLLVTTRSLPNGGALLVFRDVSALRRLEAVRRDFVANVSHELKTPLTSIAGYAETLAAETEPASQLHGFAETILSNARRMQRLVDDLLDLSRIESGGWKPSKQLVDVALAAEDAWSAFADRARAQQVRFDVVTTPNAETVLADPDALRQIFVNLFDNALRHTKSGGSITVRALDSADGVTLDVEDTGSGMAPEHLPRIFERFYRADASRSRAEGGTGLGLSIVKHLVEGHRGRVSATSALGRGTTISLFFPGEPRA
ncbi:MAG TPA: ATP-binding protein [Gemmatimonadales bacterium]|nr:ATP-binding protein [Gemmatimonadales bacterium]